MGCLKVEQKEMDLLLEVFIWMFSMHLVNGKMTIDINQTYYETFKPLNISCRSTEPFKYNYSDISINGFTIAGFQYSPVTKTCDLIDFKKNRTEYICRDTCYCSPDGRFISLVYNFTQNDTKLEVECIALNPLTDNKTLYKADGPEEPILNESSVRVNEGQKVGPLLCKTDCIPECSYIWTDPRGCSTNVSELWIDNVNRTDNGSYTCKAVNPGTNKSVSSKLDLIVYYGPNKATLYPPDITYTIAEGDSFGNVSCTSQCYPECTTTWVGPGINHTTKFLYIPSVHRRNTGQFECNVTNKIMTRQAIVNLIVQYAAEVTTINVTHNEKDFITENTTLEFICEAIGEPKPTVTWRFTNMSSSTIPISTSNQFVVEKTSCKDTGIYTCNANNSIFPPSNATLFLNVTCGPSFYEYCSKCNTKDILTVKRNETESVSACFFSNPIPASTWTKTGVNNSVSVCESVSELYDHTTFIYTTVVNVSLIEEKEINLTISTGNVFGNSSTICQLRLEDRPLEPTNVEVSCKKRNRMQWVSNFNGGKDQVFIVHYFERNDTIFRSAENVSDKGTYKMHTYELTDLKPNTLYSFFVEARNIIDSSESKIVTCTTADVQSRFLNFAAIGGGTVGGLVAVTALVIMVIIYKRRLLSKSNEKESGLIQSNKVNHVEEEDAYGLKDNPIYDSHTDTNVDYRCVSRPEEQQQECENAEMNKNMSVKIYENHMTKKQVPKKATVTKSKKNKDGLMYADLDLQPSGSRFVVRGIENKTNYAMIDLTKTAEPLPSSDDEKPKDIEQ